MDGLCAYCVSYLTGNITRDPFRVALGFTDRAKNLISMQRPVKLGRITLTKIDHNMPFPTVEAFIAFYLEYGDEFLYTDGNGSPVWPRAITTIRGTAVCLYHVPQNMNFRHLQTPY